MVGDAARFVGLEDGSLLIEEGDGDLTPLANAIEREIARPYRATAAHPPCPSRDRDISDNALRALAGSGDREEDRGTP